MVEKYLASYFICTALISPGFSLGEVSRICSQYQDTKSSPHQVKLLKAFQTHCDQKFKYYREKENAEKVIKYKWMKKIGFTTACCLPGLKNPLLQASLLQYKQAKKQKTESDGFQLINPATLLARIEISDKAQRACAMAISQEKDPPQKALAIVQSMPSSWEEVLKEQQSYYASLAFLNPESDDLADLGATASPSPSHASEELETYLAYCSIALLLAPEGNREVSASATPTPLTCSLRKLETYLTNYAIAASSDQNSNGQGLSAAVSTKRPCSLKALETYLLSIMARVPEDGPSDPELAEAASAPASQDPKVNTQAPSSVVAQEDLVEAFQELGLKGTKLQTLHKACAGDRNGLDFRKI